MKERLAGKLGWNEASIDVAENRSLGNDVSASWTRSPFASSVGLLANVGANARIFMALSALMRVLVGLTGSVATIKWRLVVEELRKRFDVCHYRVRGLESLLDRMPRFESLRRKRRCISWERRVDLTF